MLFLFELRNIVIGTREAHRELVAETKGGVVPSVERNGLLADTRDEDGGDTLAGDAFGSR